MYCPSVTRHAILGSNISVVGMQASGKSWKRFMRSYSLFSVSTKTAPMICMASVLVWLPPSRHNFCIWLNLQLGRNRLAFVDLIDW
jgi:hypothetical protein